MSAYDTRLTAAQRGTYNGLYRGGYPSSGDVIHRRGCAYLPRHRLPWQWAEGRSIAEIAATTENGLRFCKHCNPLEWLASRSVGDVA